jgi:hypothetical protein
LFKKLTSGFYHANPAIASFTYMNLGTGGEGLFMWPNLSPVWASGWGRSIEEEEEHLHLQQTIPGLPPELAILIIGLILTLESGSRSLSNCC